MLSIEIDKHQLEFEQLKTAMSTILVLKLSDFTKPFALEADACNAGMGFVLIQDGSLLAYLSDLFSPP